METKQFVGSNVNVSSNVNMILTPRRQTCGQRSSMAAGSNFERRALENYFCERFCHMFSKSKCRGDWDLDLCTFWVLAKRESLRGHVGNFWKKCVSTRANAGKIGIWPPFLVSHFFWDQTFVTSNPRSDKVRRISMCARRAGQWYISSCDHGLCCQHAHEIVWSQNGRLRRPI